MSNYGQHPLHHNIYFTLATKAIVIADLLEEYLRLKIKSVKEQEQIKMENQWKN